MDGFAGAEVEQVHGAARGIDTESADVADGGERDSKYEVSWCFERALGGHDLAGVQDGLMRLLQG